MTGFDTGATLAERMRRHAGDSTHLYGHLMRAMADDWDAGGVVAQICSGHEDAPPGSVLQLRLLGGLFRIVLTGRAPELVPYYPCLGGGAPPSQTWPHVRPVLAAHVQELRRALLVAPQTNEPGRATALLVGLFDVVRATGLTQVRLLEPGASAGLNLLVDRFRFENADWSYGPRDSPLVLRDGVVGAVRPTDFTVVDRRGCDLAPVDPTSDTGQLLLRSFVWPFHVDRYQRLANAFEVVANRPTVVDTGSAGEWLEQQFGAQPRDDVLTVVWHSIAQLYWQADEVRWVRTAIAHAAASGPVARVTMEYPDGGELAEVAVSTSDHGVMTTPRTIATANAHGQPVTMT